MNTRFTIRVAAVAACSLAAVGAAPPNAPADAAYRNALVAAIHRLAVDSWDADHLAAMLERHPDLANERVTFRQPRKPLSTDDYTAIHYAAQSGNEKAVALLLKYKVAPDSPVGADWTPLHLAARHGHLEVVKTLVAAGAKVDAKTAAIPEHVAPSEPPLRPGQQPPLVPAIPAYTALELASEGKHADVVKYLESLKR